MTGDQRDSKAIKISFSAPDYLILRAKEKAGTNFSSYLTRLIEKDLANIEPEPLTQTIIIDLARPLIGELDAQDLERKLGSVDQPKILQVWLRSLLEESEQAEESEGLDIRGTLAKQESIARRILRRKGLQNDSDVA